MAIALALAAVVVVGVGAVAVMLVEAFSTHRPPAGPPREVRGLALGSAIVLFAGAAFAGTVWMVGIDTPDMKEAAAAVSPWIIADSFTLFFDMVLCLGGALAALLAGGYMVQHRPERGEVYSLILFSTFGAMTLAAAGDVLTLFLGLQTMSIGAYAMTAFRRPSPRSAEGALKYFLLGSFAAALLIYGFAPVYGAPGHPDLAGHGRGARPPA